MEAATVETLLADFLFVDPNVLPLLLPPAGLKDVVVLAGAFETIAGIDDGLEVTVLLLDPGTLSVPTPVLVTIDAGSVVVPLTQSATMVFALVLALDAATLAAAILDILLLLFILMLVLLLPLMAAAAGMLLLLLAVFLLPASGTTAVMLSLQLSVLMGLVVKIFLFPPPCCVAFLANFFKEMLVVVVPDVTAAAATAANLRLLVLLLLLLLLTLTAFFIDCRFADCFNLLAVDF